jgi:hypothetical protein
MSTFLLVLASVLISVVLTGAAVSRAHRRRFREAGETFACRVRVVAGSPPGWSGGWDRSRAHGVWVHDVLVLQRGRWFPRLITLAVRLPDDSIRAAGRAEFRRLGLSPVVIDLRLDDGALVRVAAGQWDRTLLAGPFLAAAIASLPPRPQERSL